MESGKRALGIEPILAAHRDLSSWIAGFPGGMREESACMRQQRRLPGEYPPAVSNPKKKYVPLCSVTVASAL